MPDRPAGPVQANQRLFMIGPDGQVYRGTDEQRAAAVMQGSGLRVLPAGQKLRNRRAKRPGVDPAQK
jgi:hypothetical protein